MKLFLKKHLAVVLGLVLIAIIIILALLLPQKSENNAVGDLENLGTGNFDDEQTPDPPAAHEPYIPIFPKPSTPSEEYLFTQDLHGDGNISLAEVHTTTVGTYIICETDCVTGDIAAAKPAVGIAKCDALGNIETSFSLQNTAPSYYVKSQITPLGLVVVTKNDNKNYLYVHVVPYTLEKVKTYLVSYADNAEIFPTEDSFIMLADCGTECIIYSYGEDSFSFQSLPACSIVEIFEYSDRYTIFYNTAEGYALCEIAKSNFRIKRESFVSSGRLQSIIPLTENGKQIFVAFEEDGGLFVKKYDASFTALERQKLGNYTVMGSGTDGKRIFLAIRGNINGIIKIGSDLSYSLAVGDSLPGNAIYDFVFIDETFYLLTTNAENKLALVKMTDGVTEARYFDTSFGNARLSPNVNGTFSVIYDGRNGDYSAVEIIGIK